MMVGYAALPPPYVCFDNIRYTLLPKFYLWEREINALRQKSCQSFHQVNQGSDNNGGLRCAPPTLLLGVENVQTFQPLPFSKEGKAGGNQLIKSNLTKR